MENLKRYIIISIIVVLVVIIAIILLLLYQKKSSEKQSANDIQKIESSTVFMDNNDKNIFYQAEECINTYYDYLNIDDYTVEEYFPGIELSFAQKNDIQNEEDKNNAILTLLDAKYKDSNSINVSNVLEFVDPIDLDNYFYRSTRQKMAEGVNTTTIYAEGEILNKNTYEKVSDVYYIVYLDYSSSTFAIYPLKENTTEIEQYIDDTIKEKSKYNYLATSKISDEDMAFKYFADFKNSAMKKTEYAFNKLDEQYRQNRFSNDKGQFDLYIDKNANELRGLTVNKYSVNTYDDYTEYICMDKYENMYIFRVTGPTNYTVTLDTYTILSDNFKNSYDKASPQGKVMLNADKWVQMLNNRDYTSAYKVLDETFRNNNFGTVDNFENYMRQNYGEHYKVTFGDFSNEGDTYIQPLTLTPISGSNQTKEITIIMRLSDNYGYAMSFVI